MNPHWKFAKTKLYLLKLPNNSLVDAQACSAELTEFERVTEDQAKSFINSCRLKTCI